MAGAADVDLVKVDQLPVFRHEARGAVTPVEFSRFVPFQPVRLFYAYDVPQGGVRGRHANRTAREYLICQSGRVRLDLADRHKDRVVTLSAGEGVLIEPGIFVVDTYLDPGAVLLVLCDKPYDHQDYIHTLDELRAG
jgi:hypothetical protein